VKGRKGGGYNFSGGLLLWVFRGGECDTLEGTEGGRE